MPDEHYKKELSKLQSEPDHSRDHLEAELKETFTFLVRRVMVEGSGPKVFKQSSLKEIVFGMRMSRSDVESQIKMIEAEGFNPKFFVASKNPKRYQLDIREL